MSSYDKQIDDLLEIVKQREGLLGDIQDEYIRAIIKGAISELENQHGIRVSLSDMDMFMFIADLSSFRYNNRDSLGDMPKHLLFRLKQFYINRSNDVG